MYQYNIVMIIWIIISILIILFILSRIELVEGYDKWEWRLFNQNWNKPWKDTAVAYNNPYVQNIPRSSNNDANFPDYILEIVKEGYVDKVLNKMTNTEVKLDGFKPVDLTWDEYYKINKNTWYNNVNDFNLYNEFNYEDNQMEFKTMKSCIPQVNVVLKYFINNFNTVFSKSFNEKFVRDYYGYSPFSIFKYKIHNIKQKKLNDGTCAVNYEFIVVLIRDESYVGITLYLNMITYHDKIYLTNTDLIGYYSTDKLFLPPGKKEVGDNNYYQLNPLYRISKRQKTLIGPLNKKNWRDLNVNYDNVWPILWRTKQYNLDNTLKNQHTCFNAEPQFYNPSGIPPTTPGSNSQPILNYVYNKYNCEAKYDQWGRRKPRGIWDRPCLSDNECIFNDQNKNYPNTFGKCNKDYGFCELPKGMKSLAYHYYYPFNVQKTKQNINNPVCNPQQGNPAPLCYNCHSINKTGKWQPITSLGNCCEQQKSRKLYPNLDGPDYAFDNDINERINYYRMQQFYKKSQK